MQPISIEHEDGRSELIGYLDPRAVQAILPAPQHLNMCTVVMLCGSNPVVHIFTKNYKAVAMAIEKAKVASP